MKKASWHAENGHNGRNQEEKVQNKDNVSWGKQAGTLKMDIMEEIKKKKSKIERSYREEGKLARWKWT